MATRSDVRDILSLPGRSKQPLSTEGPQAATSASGGSAAPKRNNPSSKVPKPKLDGISRELYALLGDNAPSLSMGPDGPFGIVSGVRGKFMPKFKRRPHKAQRWEKSFFKNPARKDDLILSHWRLASDLGNISEEDGESRLARAPRREYQFADLNTGSGAYSYSNDEYHQHLRDDDWTKEETDYLIDLCHAYDLRFVIITDRYDWEGKERSMEDLKARYYAICRRLIRSRISTDDFDTRSALVLTYSFDRAREVERKKHVARLYSRTPEQLAEEEALYVEARRLEQNEGRFAAEREELMRLLGGWERVPTIRAENIAVAGSGLNINLPGSAAAAEEGLESRRKKRKAEGVSISSGAFLDDEYLTGGPLLSITATTSAVSNRAALSSKQKAELKTAHFDEQHMITRFDPNTPPPTNASTTAAAGGSTGSSSASQQTKVPYPHLVGVASTYPPVAPSVMNPSSSHGAFLRSQRMLVPRSSISQRAIDALKELRPNVGPRLVFPTVENAEKWEGLVGAVTSGLEMKRQLDRVESELRVLKLRQQQGQIQLHTQTQGPVDCSIPSGQNRLLKTPTPGPDIRSSSQTRTSQTPFAE